MADKQEKQDKKGPRGLIGTILANKRKREAAEGADGNELSRPVVQNLTNTWGPGNRNFFTGDHNTMVATVDNVDSFASLGYQFKDKQRNGLFPESTVTIRKNDRNQIARSRLPIDDQRKPALASTSATKAVTAPPVRPPPTTSEQMDVDSEEPQKKKRKRNNRGKKKKNKGKSTVPREKQPCGWCGKLGHEVLECAGPPAEDGYIHACPLHNTRAHTGAECRKAEDWDVGQKWCYQVTWRRHLPPLAYKETWEKVAWDYVQARGANVVDQSNALPLTAGFAKTIDKATFEAFDYTKESAEGQLGCEDATSTLEVFLSWATKVFAPKKDDSGDATMVDAGKTPVVSAAPMAEPKNLPKISKGGKDDDDLHYTTSSSSDNEVIRNWTAHQAAIDISETVAEPEI